MGNGALPHGPSYRAHPRLYRNRPSAMSALQPLSGGKRTHCGHVATAVFDPYRTSRPHSITSSAMSRSEEHTSELQSHLNLVCRLLLEKKKANKHKEEMK